MTGKGRRATGAAQDDPIDRTGLTPGFWRQKRLDKLSPKEWEALCDGCGKCCLNKLEDADTGAVALTRVACRLFDDSTCRCGQYQTRHQTVPECITLTPRNIARNAYWMPDSCAYKRLWEGHDLPEWHPLVTGRSDSVHDAGVSVIGQTVSEATVDEEDWEDHIIEEP